MCKRIVSIKWTCWCKKRELENAAPIKLGRGTVLTATALVFGETFLY